MTNNDSISSLTFYFSQPFFDKQAIKQANHDTCQLSVMTFLHESRMGSRFCVWMSERKLRVKDDKREKASC